MPYDVRKRGDRYCVIKRDDGKNMGCHDSKKDAEDQSKAILANEAAVWESVCEAVAHSLDGCERKADDGD